MTSRALIPWLLAGALAAAPASALAANLEVDHAASTVAFSAKATMHSFDGQIKAWDLELSLPDGAELPDRVVFRGDGLTMTTDHTKRDAEMHHWMEHDAFPAVEFRLTRFSGTPEARIAEGDLALHGVTRPVAIPIRLQREGDKLTVTGEVTVNTAEFGLPQFRKLGMLTVSQDVRVSFTVVGALK